LEVSEFVNTHIIRGDLMIREIAAHPFLWGVYAESGVASFSSLSDGSRFTLYSPFSLLCFLRVLVMGVN